MARHARIWFRKQDGWFYTILDGRQTRLSQDKQEARRVFHELMSGRREKQGRRLSFKKLADLFLVEGRRSKAPRTRETQYMFLQSFCDTLGNRKAEDLKVHLVSSWLEETEWGESTRTAARATVLACLNWGVTEGHIAHNPLSRLRRGRYNRRERILKPEEKKRILDVASGRFRQFLTVLGQTGARPFSEVAKITAEMIDFGDGTITFEKHKNSKRGKDRTIYMTPDIATLLKELARAGRPGPLLVTQKGHPWTKDSVSKWMRKLERSLGIPRITPYAWRHTYITDCLAKGMSASIVGELVGSSARTIERYYKHLDQQKQTLREAALRAVSG